MKPGTIHNRTQKERKRTALDEAKYAAEYLGSDGKQLKEKRTGKKLTTALIREMKERGYRPTNTPSGWRRLSQ